MTAPEALPCEERHGRAPGAVAEERWRRICAAALGRDDRSRPFHLLVNRAAASRLTRQVDRQRLYSLAGIDLTVGRCFIDDGCWIHDSGLTIGIGALINRRCYFRPVAVDAPITLGRYCNIGPEVMFMTLTHEHGKLAGQPDRNYRRAGRVYALPITVGDACWIGARVTILPGAHVGAGCVVAAGAVVARDLEPHGLYAGVPARRVRDLEPPQPGITRATER